MKTTNMGSGMRTSVLVFVILVYTQLIVGKPFFGALWCDFFCDDYDDDLTTSTTSLEDLLDSLFDPCSDCPTRRPTTPRIPTMSPGMQQPFNFMIPPSNTGMNLTMTNTGTSWFMNFMPWGPGPATPAPMPPAATTTAAPPAAAAATTPAADTNATTPAA